MAYRRGSSFKMDWNGRALETKVERVTIIALNRVVDEARDDARENHAWIDRTGQLESNIVSEHARTKGYLQGRGARKRMDPSEARLTASFGTTRGAGFYGLFHEVGTVNEIARPFLRPAADRNFGNLPHYIRLGLRAHGLTMPHISPANSHPLTLPLAAIQKAATRPRPSDFTS